MTRHGDWSAKCRELTNDNPNPYMEDQRYALLKRIDEMLEDNRKLARQLRRNTTFFLIIIGLVLLVTVTLTLY